MSDTNPPPGSTPDPYQPPAGSPPPPPSTPQYGGADAAGHGTPAPPPGYGAPGAPGSPPPPPDQYGVQGPKSEPLAIVALVLGLIGICCSTIFVLSAVALITGFLGKKRIDESGGRRTGRGLAIAGMVLGALGIVVGIVWWILVGTGVVEPSTTLEFGGQ